MSFKFNIHANKIYILFSILLLRCEAERKNDTKQGESGSKCGSTLAILNCDFDDPPLFSRRYLNKLKALYTPGTLCPVVESHFHWDIILENETEWKFDNYKYRDTFHIEPYMIGGGMHSFMVFINEIYNDGQHGSLNEACIFVIIPENPIPIIQGGLEVTVESGKSFTMDGRDSIDMEIPPHQKGHLHYHWNCLLNNGSATLENFCHDQLPNGAAVLQVPQHFAVENYVYTFELAVKSRESDWVNTTQIVKVKTNVAKLKIMCLKNCPPLVLLTNVKETIIFKVVCQSDKKKKDLQRWSINKIGFDYEKDTKYGRNNEIFFIKESVLDSGEIYELKVELQGELTGGTAVEIKTHKPPKLESCSVSPQSGEALKTEFSVHCKYPDGSYMFEIFGIVGETEILLEKSARLLDIVFVLPTKSKIKVKIIDEYEFSDSKILDVTVKDFMDTSKPKEELIKEIESTFFDEHSEKSFGAMMKEEKFDKVVQFLGVFSKELEAISQNKELEDVVNDYKMKMFDILDKIPLDSRDRTIQVSGISKEIAEQTKLKQNPIIAEKASKICKDAAKRELELVQHERFKESFSEEILEDSKLFSECSQVGLNPNLELLDTPDVFEPTTQYPLLEFPVVQENYPDYPDDENVSKALSKLDSYVENLVDLCFLNAKSLLITFTAYDNGKYIDSGAFNVTATKAFGKDISTVTIASHKTILKPSKDFLVYKNDEIDISFCTSTKNPYWWQTNPKVSPPIAILEFKKKRKRIKEFSKPFSLSFDHPVSELITTHSGVTPRKPNITDNDKKYYNFELITMYRIDVFREEDYFIEFVDLGSSSLNVYVTKYYKPSFEEFKSKCRKINADNSKLFVTNNRNYDHWHYLSILPSEEMGEAEVSFSLKIYTVACYKWNFEERKWEFSCDSTNTSTILNIECLCHKSSVLSGRVTNNAIREEHTVYVYHKLEIQACYIIFLTVLIVWILYCIFLTYFSITGRKKTIKEIFFLSDTPSTYRYGYLIIIKTGNKKNASTTSNIVIKLYGRSSNSIEHVLNYPDPDKRLLQKNQEDWCFLATEHYLGDIEKIQLWFDCIGHRPSWYCSEIELIDLQTKNNWTFSINFKFEIKDIENYFYTATPVDAGKSKLSLKNVISALHGCHMWNICEEDASLSKIARLTAMLSIFFTSFTIMLLLYGVPVLKPSDSISVYPYYGFYHETIWITVIGFILTFAMHYPIVYYLKTAKNQNTVLKEKNIKKICWSILTFLIVTSMIVTLIFGFWVPHVTSLLWLSSSIASLLIYIFLLENIIVIYNNLSLKKRTRIDRIFSTVNSMIKYVEIQREKFYSSFGKFGMRPYFKHLYEPLDEEKIREIKYWAKMKDRLYEIFEDILMITVYIILLYTIILRDKDPMATKSNEEIKDLIKGVHSRTFSEYFHGRQEIEKYIETTLVHSLQSPQWYGQFLSKDPGMTIDNSNKFIGIARIRQHRSDKETCSVVPAIVFLQTNCTSSFSDGPEYERFSEGWMNGSESDSFARMDCIFKYRGVGTGTLAYIGKFATYPGGGYVSTLGRTLKNSLTNVKYLLRHRWIDERTRIIFVEFLTYSANTNIFNAVSVIFELSLTGYIRSVFDVYTARLLLVNENLTLLWIIFASFIMIVLLLTIKLIRQIMKDKKIAFKNVWHLVDIFIILTSLACMFLYLKRSHLVGEFLDRIEVAKHNEFVNYFHLFYAENILTVMAAVLVFLATLRLWKLMRFLIIIRVVEKTLLLSAVPLLCLCVCHLHLIVVFAISGSLLFGDESYDFSNFTHSFMSLVLGSIGFFGFDFDTFESYLHYLYFITYTLLTMLVVTVYVAVISIYYSEAQNFYSNYQEYNVLNFIKENFEYYKELCKVRLKRHRLKGGEDKNVEERKLVYPKANEDRFAKCLTVEKHKMAAMKQIALNVLRNFGVKKARLSQNDVNLILETLVTLYRETKDETNDFFFLSNVQGQKTKLVDDAMFLKMENILNSVYRGEKEVDLYRKVVEDNNMQLDRILHDLNVVKSGLNSIVFDEY